MNTFFKRALLITFLISFLVAHLPLSTFAQSQDSDKPTSKHEKKPIPSLVEFSKDKLRYDGFIPYYWDPVEGKVFLEVSRPDQDFLYVHSLATGLGSNPVGLDRGQMGAEKLVCFQRIGPKVLLVQKNVRFRANTENQLERRAVEQSFAQSVLWGGKVVAESNGIFVIDVSDLLLTDVHGVVAKLKQAEQGEFSIDEKRSAVYLERCKAFPKNTELEATLTFSSKKPGPHVRQTAPSPQSVSLRQHHSFIELPDNDYRPRVYDVRSPSIFITFADYASPLDRPLQQRWITRHRLEKKNPGQAISKPVEPIVYYVDAGAPEQIQDALIEGASWGNEAFESAGFQDAFEVKLLPPDADPLDVRYNVIQWVHRSTRGWSYGGSVIDPRTGEIIKGHVTLGSLRVRQDQLLVNSLDNPPSGMHCACCGIGGVVEESTLVDLASRQKEGQAKKGQAKASQALEVALARIRQLSAHEVGHTLGFVHNFAASTYADRASVMDYPAPRVKITEQGTLDLSDAYGVGIGAWDKVAVQFAYAQFDHFRDSVGHSNAFEKPFLDKILESAANSNMLFLSDADARPAGAAHPLANLWDNGTDPLAELAHVMRVRRIALDNFDISKLPAGTVTADVAQFLTPVYLHHRYQLQAVGKLIGGHNYQYGYASSETAANVPIDPALQRQAVEALLNTITPKELALRTEVLQKISPKPYSAIRDQEMLPTKSGRIFDPLAAAKVASDLTLAELLQHERLSRLIGQSKDGAPTPWSVVEKLIVQHWAMGQQAESNETDIARVTCGSIVDHLITLADHPKANGQVRAAATAGLKMILTYEAGNIGPQQRFMNMTSRRIKLFLDRPFSVLPDPSELTTPPGSPIGSSSSR